MTRIHVKSNRVKSRINCLADIKRKNNDFWDKIKKKK